MVPIYEKKERLLTIEKFGVSYGDKVILHDINLHIDNIVRPGMKQGQAVAVLGPSGIGKTQLFRAIAGLMKPTTGTITLDEAHTPVRAGMIGVIQQQYPLMQHRTILSNLRLAARNIGATADAEIDQHLIKFGLIDKKSSYPLELSGGQRQRIAIIQQLLCNNHFLLMDEPFSGLDPIAKENVYDTIRTVTTADEHNTVIFTTHDLQSAVRLADEIWVLGREPGKPGASIVACIDLIEKGLAWDPDIGNNPAFWPQVQELYTMFKTL